MRNPHSTISSMLNLVNSQGDWSDRCVVIQEIERFKPFFWQEFRKEVISD